MRWRIEGEAPGVPGPPKAMDGGGRKARKGFKQLVIDDLSLATPMLGGGVESLKVDTEMPIRAQSVRGQLRFWWRTFQSCETADDLRRSEDARLLCRGSSIAPGGLGRAGAGKDDGRQGKFFIRPAGAGAVERSGSGVDG